MGFLLFLKGWRVLECIKMEFCYNVQGVNQRVKSVANTHSHHLNDSPTASDPHALHLSAGRLSLNFKIFFITISSPRDSTISIRHLGTNARPSRISRCQQLIFTISSHMVFCERISIYCIVFKS